MFALSFAVQVTHLQTFFTIFRTHYSPLINSFEGADQTFLQGLNTFSINDLNFSPQLLLRRLLRITLFID